MAMKVTDYPTVVVNGKTKEELLNSKTIPKGGDWFRVINKDYFLPYVNAAHIFTDLKKHFHNRILYNTLKYYGIDTTELRYQGRCSISASQKEQNSNKVNWGIPRTIVDKDQLQSLLDSKWTLVEIARHFNISDFLLKSNIEYHKVSRNSDYALMPKSIKRSDYANILELERLFNIPLTEDIINQEYIGDKLKLLHDSLYDLRQTVLMLKRHNGAFGMARSHGEMLVQNFLDNEGVLYVNQFKIGNKIFDFLLPEYNVLIEVDGYLHTKETDRIKGAAARLEGYNLIRLVDNIFVSKSKKICFNILRSKILPQLGNK